MKGAHCHWVTSDGLIVTHRFVVNDEAPSDSAPHVERLGATKAILLEATYCHLVCSCVEVTVFAWCGKRAVPLQFGVLERGKARLISEEDHVVPEDARKMAPAKVHSGVSIVLVASTGGVIHVHLDALLLIAKLAAEDFSDLRRVRLVVHDVHAPFAREVRHVRRRCVVQPSPVTLDVDCREA